MNPTDASAIATYLKDGGQIVRVKGTVRATEQEVLDYLGACGLKAKYFPDDPRPYLCNNKRHSLTSLIRLANSHRRSRQLSPFILGIYLTPTRRG